MVNTTVQWLHRREQHLEKESDAATGIDADWASKGDAITTAIGFRVS